MYSAVASPGDAMSSLIMHVDSSGLCHPNTTEVVMEYSAHWTPWLGHIALGHGLLTYLLLAYTPHSSPAVVGVVM